MTIKERGEALAKEFSEARAKGSTITGMPQHDTSNATSDEKALVGQWFKALANRDNSTLRELDVQIEKDYISKGFLVTKAQNDTTGGAGGYLVPAILDGTIRKKLRFVSPIRQMATVIANMPANLNLPSENALPTTYWAAEGAAGTDAGSVFDLNNLVPHKLIGLDSMTHETLVDAATNESIQNFVLDRFTLALSLAENDAFTNGDGTDRPFGFRSSAITPNAVAQVGTTAGSLAYTDLTNLMFTLNPAYRHMGQFAANAKALQLLTNLRDNNGRPLFTIGSSFGGIADERPDMLLGKPINEVAEIPSNLGVGTNQTEIWFGLWTNYIIGDREALRVDVGTNGTDFASDKLTLRIIKRVAGKPIIGESFSKLTAVF